MNNKRYEPSPSGALKAACGAAFCLAIAPAYAQDVGRSLTGTVAADPNPYYVGVGQGFTHDSNVYRSPSGPSDTYSSTSVFGGFEQPISRQRIFGRGGVSLNRYQDKKDLDNTSYDFSLGANLETIENISGNVNLGFSQSLSAPVAGLTVPTLVANEVTTKRAELRLRWGGPSQFTVEGGLNYVDIDYSAPQYVTSESSETGGSIGLFYRPGAYLRVGIAGRFERTKTPKAIVNPVSGAFQPNTTDGKNVDLIVDYVVDEVLRTNARLSYTQQTNSVLFTSDFSGFTGSLAVSWQATAKTAVQLDISRDAGFEANSLNRYAVVDTGTGVVLTPVTTLYQNNRVTDSAGIGVTYQATAKLGSSANLRYSRARLAADIEITGIERNVDVSKLAALSLNYAITRAWSANCNVTYEERDVAALVTYSYTAKTVGCATQFTWR